MIQWEYKVISSHGRGFFVGKMRKIILPILYIALIMRPAFLGGSVWTSPNVLDAVSTVAIAASKPADAPVSEPKKFDIWLTAYSSVPDETDDSPLITATNKTVRDGFIAANFLPFGTKVKIPEFFGDKVFVVEDRMSRRKTDFMDIWMPSKEKATEFGIHRAEVIVVEMGTIPNPMPNPAIAKNTADKNPATD
jgi:3D (Asp-Asp-Asp) domain-containing protein